MNRCPWASTDLSLRYHDEEWGVPQHNDQVLFEFLVLEGAQAGLSWETILKKRDHYREVFKSFDPITVAGFDQEKINRLLIDPGIIRNRLKINAAIQNAKVFLEIQEQYGSFDDFIWQYCEGTPIHNNFASLSDLPAETAVSRQISKDLKTRGMSFVGPTIIYAFMQAIGMVNDHLVDCFRYDIIRQL
jgi:DNA-3-methyladenine glycosylase I